jgi:hypothetical protein
MQRCNTRAAGSGGVVPATFTTERTQDDVTMTTGPAPETEESTMEMSQIENEEDLTDLLGKIVGRLEEKTLALHMLVALLEEKGLLRTGEVDEAMSVFLREQGRDYFVESWGEAMGEGLYEGLSLKELQ